MSKCENSNVNVSEGELSCYKVRHASFTPAPAMMECASVLAPYKLCHWQQSPSSRSVAAW